LILTQKKKALIISTFKSSGEQQMSIDLNLLEKTISDNNILFTLRFYIWEGNWISIGYHQNDFPSHWKELKEQGLIDIVRRPSGGGAVLHSGGITYALTFRKPEYRKYSYQLINAWFIKSFKTLGVDFQNGSLKKAAIIQNCFSTSNISDLLDFNGYKRIGSAQYWKKGSFLQHGEIQLNPPLELWKKVFGVNPPPKLNLAFSNVEIIEHLKKSFLENFSDPSLEHIFLNPHDLVNQI
tara:strand:+ start:80 stop:793 length:714 start_codon:yes stop_codon:yes gene_type:complete